MNSREASDELMSSKKFQKLLEIILMVGNYLNTGSRNAQSLGFDLNYLTKVSTCFQTNATVLPTKSDSDVILCLHFLS